MVWTSLIGHAFLDAYDHFRKEDYLRVAVSACEHILRDLETFADGGGLCISYIPGMNKQVHNANTLGASLLARTYSHTGTNPTGRWRRRRSNTRRSISGRTHPGITARRRTCTGSTIFTTAYVLDCFKYYAESTGDDRFDQQHDEWIRILEKDILSGRWNAAILRPQDAADRHSVLFAGDRYARVLPGSRSRELCRWR